MTHSELYKKTASELKQSLEAREADATARLLIDDVLGLSQVKLITDGDRSVEPETVARFESFTARINSGEPPQYVVGKARFMGNDFIVNPSVLIPRPETEGLVDMIVDFASKQSDLKILDLGTGSGCIAVSLARALPFANVTAIDNSQQALDIARKNADRLAPTVNTIFADIFDLPQSLAPVDIIVSNPPYVADHERQSIENRVIDHEPHSALFVPDDDPLRFYTAIARWAIENSPNAHIFFEINPLYADRLKSSLQTIGYKEIELSRDIHAKLRYAHVSPSI